MHRVLLLVQPRLLRESLRERLTSQSEFQVVGEIEHEVDLLLAIRATQADLVIHTWPTEDLPGLYSHLLVEFPGLTLIGLRPGSDVPLVCEHRLTLTPLTQSRLSALVTDLCPVALPSVALRV